MQTIVSWAVAFWQRRSVVGKGLLVAVVVLAVALGLSIPLLSHSIAKRNRLLRQQQSIITGLQAKLKLRELQAEQLRVRIKLRELQSKESLLGKKTKEIEAKKKTHQVRIQKLQEGIRTEEKRGKVAVQKVDRMNIDQQIKAVEKVVNGWEL